MDRIVRRLSTNPYYSPNGIDNRFIATDHAHWAARHAAWMADQAKPCPYPKGHRMFRHPDEYQMELELSPQGQLVAWGRRYGPHEEREGQ